MTHYFIVHCVQLLTCYALFGFRSVRFMLIYGILGIFWLEVVNYIEHYGLRRKIVGYQEIELKNKEGNIIKEKKPIYESINYLHSWSSVSSPVGYRLQRHSDHHAHSFRPYQTLRRLPASPTMPYEYILMLFMAIFPPIFFYIMDPRLDSLVTF